MRDVSFTTCSTVASGSMATCGVPAALMRACTEYEEERSAASITAKDVRCECHLHGGAVEKEDENVASGDGAFLCTWRTSCRLTLVALHTLNAVMYSTDGTSFLGGDVSVFINTFTLHAKDA